MIVSNTSVKNSTKSIPNKPWVAIEGLGRKGSVAIAVSGKNLVIQSEQVGEDSKYSSSILPLIKKLLSNFSLTVLDIKGLILVNGPGSFTGLRVTNGLIHGLAHGLNCPVVSVSAFEVYAFAWHQNLIKAEAIKNNTFFVDVILDARLEEYFLARVQCKKIKQLKNNGSPATQSSLSGYLWEFSISEEPSIVDNSSLQKRNSSDEVKILKCPNINDFEIFTSGGFEFYPNQKYIFLSGWAALFCIYNQNTKWKKAKEIQPLYVRDRVAQTILERKKTPALILESFNNHDLETISSIEQDTYQFGWTRRNFQDSLNSNYICKKLINNSLLVGYFIWMKVDNECHILNFTIANGRQRRGLGQWMLARLLDSLGEFKLESVFLEVRPSNKSAINLYGKNGFEIVGRRKNYYSTFEGKEDALVMKRLILKNRTSFV